MPNMFNQIFTVILLKTFRVLNTPRYAPVYRYITYSILEDSHSFIPHYISEIELFVTVGVWKSDDASPKCKYVVVLHLPPALNISMKDLEKLLKSEYNIGKKASELQIHEWKLEFCLYTEKRNIACDSETSWQKMKYRLVEQGPKKAELVGELCNFNSNFLLIINLDNEETKKWNLFLKSIFSVMSWSIIVILCWNCVSTFLA